MHNSVQLNKSLISINMDHVIYIKTEIDYSIRVIDVFIYMLGDKCLKDEFDFSDFNWRNPEIDTNSGEGDIHDAVMYYYKT